jgi:hypothetical protein
MLHLTLTLAGVFSSVLSQGYGCDEDYQYDQDRVDCGDHDTVEETCRNEKNCTWCPAEPDTAVPWCYIPSIPTAGAGYVMVGEPILSPDSVTVELVRSAPRGRRLTPRWDGEAESLTLTAEFQSNDRVRVRVSVAYRFNSLQSGGCTSILIM